MKRVCAVLLALVLACGCLAGCMPRKAASSSSVESIGTIQEETKERFVDLETGEKAFNFTAEEFKYNFNNLTDKSEQKIEDWAQAENDIDIFYTYEYEDESSISALADPKTKLVKFLIASTNLLGGGDSASFGENLANMFLTVDPSLDSESRRNILEELKFIDVDSWYAGMDTNTTKHGVFYGLSIDETYKFTFTIMPIPDFNSSTSVSSYSASKASSSEAPISQEPPQPAEQVLLDQIGIKITYIGLEEDMFRSNIKLRIENNTETPITVQQRDMSVNGIMIDGIFSCDVAVGKIANDEISIFPSDLEENGIDQIENIELRFHIYDDDTWDTVLDSEMILFNI